MSNISIVLADDHPVIRQGLRNLLAREERFTIVGETGDGADALQLIFSKNPDVAVLDISMPSMSGLDVVEEILKNEQCPTEIIILTMYTEEVYFSQAMDLGVKGYLLKDSVPADIVSCVKAIADGRAYVSSAMSHYLVKRSLPKSLVAPPPSLEALTPQERRVLTLLSTNKTSREIAEELHISIRTVQHHRSNICAKLNLEGFNSLLLYAIEQKSLLHSGR